MELEKRLIPNVNFCEYVLFTNLKMDMIKQSIAFTDKKINALVYKLYVLNEEEIKIIETAK